MRHSRGGHTSIRRSYQQFYQQFYQQLSTKGDGKVDKMSLREAIKYYRGLKGWSQLDLSFESELSLATITSIESDKEGRRNVNLFTLKRIADVFDITVSELLKRAGY